MPLSTQNQNANLFLSLNFRFITQSNAFEYFAPFSLDCWEHFEPFYGLVDVWAEWKNTLCKGFGNISLWDNIHLEIGFQPYQMVDLSGIMNLDNLLHVDRKEIPQIWLV